MKRKLIVSFCLALACTLAYSQMNRPQTYGAMQFDGYEFWTPSDRYEEAKGKWESLTNKQKNTLALLSTVAKIKTELDFMFSDMEKVSAFDKPSVEALIASELILSSATSEISIDF